MPDFLYENADADQKRRLLGIVMSNCTAMGKKLEFSLREPFLTLARGDSQQSCAPDWNTARTSKKMRVSVTATIERSLLECGSQFVGQLTAFFEPPAG